MLINPQTKTILAIKDTNVTIQAKVNNALSNKVALNIYWEVNGYRLPPEPDPKINNATLLGVDSNDNGVRDDVERWIYTRYKKKHPIYIALAMDGAEAFQEALKGQEHYAKAHEMSTWAIDCSDYYKNYAQILDHDKNIIDEDDRIVGRELLSKVLTTQERIDAYMEYDHSLSGGIYQLTNFNNLKPHCSSRVKEVLK